MTKNLPVVSFLIALLALGVAVFKTDNAATAQKETAYERVIRTKTLRCGYAMWPPYLLTKDANTGKLSGAAFDIVNEMGKNLSLNVEWAEESGWDSWTQGLNTGRYDAFCATAYRTAAKGREVRFVAPVFYNSVHAYVRADDARFDGNNLDKLNDPSVTFSTMDGEISGQVHARFFPKAKTISLPSNAQFDSLFLNIVTKKADIVFNEPSITDDFIAKNPGSLKKITTKPFLTFSGSPVAVGIHETDLQTMLDNSLTEMRDNGTIERLLMKNGATPNYFMRPAMSYKETP